MKFNSLVPELSVSDIEKSKEFYLKLGFAIQYERKEDKFCFLELEENQIMLEEVNENWSVGPLSYPYGRGINLSMSVKNIAKMYEDLKDENFTFFKDLETHEYKVGDKTYFDREFLLQDPDGYLLRFND